MDRFEKGLSDGRVSLLKKLTKAENDRIDNALWEDEWTARSLSWRWLAEYCDIEREER